MSEITDAWIKNAFVRRDIDRALIEDSLAWLYGLIELPNPIVYYAQSPLDCQRIASELKSERQWQNLNNEIKFELERKVYRLVPDKVADKVRKQVWEQAKPISLIKLQLEFALRERLKKDGFESFCSDGMRAIQWCLYYVFFGELGIIKSKDFERYCDFIFNSGIFMSMNEASCAIVCPNPSHAKLNERFQLHCTDGPAMAWEDGYKLYSLNGVTVSEAVFAPSHEITPWLLLSEKNAEARREIIRKIGIERVIGCFGAEIIDKWHDYELLAFELQGMQIKPIYLKMLNPSTGVWHIEGVPPEIKSCKEALAWRDGEAEYIVPEQLT